MDTLDYPSHRRLNKQQQEQWTETNQPLDTSALGNKTVASSCDIDVCRERSPQKNTPAPAKYPHSATMNMKKCSRNNLRSAPTRACRVCIPTPTHVSSRKKGKKGQFSGKFRCSISSLRCVRQDVGSCELMENKSA